MNQENETMRAVCLDTVCAITEISRSTWQRRIGKGEFTQLPDGLRGRKMLLWSEVEPYICVSLTNEERRLVFAADFGEPEAQNDVGQLFFLADKAKAAYYWFQLAAQQGCVDAMHWLGQCHLMGAGVVKDDHMGLMWIAKSAALGHAIAQGQMTWLIGQAGTSRC